MSNEILADGESSSDVALWGVRAITAAVNDYSDPPLKERQVYYMLEAGHLPAKKVGRKWVGSRLRLREALVGEGA